MDLALLPSRPMPKDDSGRQAVPMEGYCAACGARAPSKNLSKDFIALRSKGWRVRPSVPLDRGPARHWVLLCASCVANPTPVVQQILAIWNARKARR